LRGLKRWLFYFLWFWVPVRKATFITAISESTKRELISLTGCDPRKVRVIPDCVSPDFAPSALRFNGECPNVLHVGTKPNKNLVRVAQALSGIGCHLTVIGKPSLAQEEALRAAQVDYSWRANLSRREMVRSYQECDLVVFASTYEGFGLPILEAQASGRPVITSDLPPMKDVAGKESCLVDPFDVSSIREGILRVIRDDGYRDELVRCGLSNVRRFSAEQVAMDYARIYAEALGRDLDL
jgi:glycosyltransferase involved in cell wall biosynthesis